MLTFWEDLLVVFVIALLTPAVLLLLNRCWPRENRRAHNDLMGWQLNIVGTIYAVILGFMLYTVWNNYTAAELNVDLEANATVDLYRLAEGLPSPQREMLQQEVSRYVTTVLNTDWPEMSRAMVPSASMSVSGAMWRTLMSVRNGSASEMTALDHALSVLSALNQHRRNRVLQSDAHLPAVLWCVLIAGAIMTVGSACLFGGSSNIVHGILVVALSVLVGLVLVAIADIYRPFQGGVHVSAYAFERALLNMRPE